MPPNCLHSRLHLHFERPSGLQRREYALPEAGTTTRARSALRPALPIKHQILPTPYNSQDRLFIQPSQLPYLQVIPCAAQVDKVDAAIFGEQLQRSCILPADPGLNVVFITA